MVGDAPYEAVNHSPEAVDASYAMARAFVNAARQSEHAFADPADRESRSFYKCAKTDATYPEFVESYAFDGAWDGVGAAC